MRKEKQLLIMILLFVALGIRGQHQKVTLNFTSTPVSQVLRTISKQTGLDFVYSNSQLESMGDITIKATKEPIGEVLKRMSASTGFTFKFDKNTIIVQQDNKKTDVKIDGYVVGVVTDADGNPLPGVTVKFMENNYGTTTSSDGRYHLNARGVSKGSISFSFIGMKNKVVAYKGQSIINVVMDEDSHLIDDVVVTGYGTYNRGQYVGAVSQVKAEDIKIANESSIDQMLQGVIPGVSVVNTTGKVGGTPKIRIRGTSTILGNQEPLWVVDGVIQTNPTPIPNDASPLSSDMDEMLQTAGNAISWLNPADIETITVLKDASATAIYGSQATNGVIVVTTKKAKAQTGVSINYSGSLSITQRPSYGLYDLMNSQQYMEFNQQMYHDRNAYTYEVLPIGYAGLVQKLHNKTITQEEFNQEFRNMEQMNTDWFDLLFRTPVSTQQNVSISSGSEKLQSRFSLGVNSSPGEAKGNDMFQVTASSNNTYRPTKNLSIDLSVNGSYRKANDFYSGVSPYDYAMNTSRALPLYNEDGSLYYYPVYGNISYSILNKHCYNYNILNELDNSGSQSAVTSFQANLGLRWKLLKNVEFQGDASLSLSSSRMKSWATEFTNTVSQIRGYDMGEVQANSEEELSSPLPYGGILNSATQQNINYSFRGAFVYNNTFAEKHSVTFNIGMQVTSYKFDGETMLHYGYQKYRGETFATVPALSDLHTVTGYKPSTDLHELMRQGSSITNTKQNQLSEYFTAVYSFDNRYVLNLNGRLDASNRFGQDENKRFNPTLSFGAKWRIGEEPWMDWASSWYDMFDISFSYGWRGNSVTEVSPYLIATDGGLHTYFKQYYLKIKSLPYPDLGWEKTRDWNIGADLSFFDGRLSAGFNYYNKRSDVLSSREVSTEYGVQSAYVKGTIMKNYGYEFIISATPIRTKDWTWSIAFNTSKDYNRVENNEIVNLPNDYLTGAAIVEGMPYGTIYAFDFAGLNPETGYPTFNGLDKEEKPVDFREYLVEAGCTEPDVAGGISTSLRYKNIHLRAQFAMSIGAQAYLPQYFATTGAPRPEQNMPTYMLDRWRQPGDELLTDIPSIAAGNPNDINITLKYGSNGEYWSSPYQMYNYSTARIADTDFIRCRSLSLQYDLPKPALATLGMLNAYITASLTNPFFIAFDSKWNGRDPETASWPARKSFTLALNITF